MAFDGALPLVRRSKATRHVSLAQSVGVEHLLQAGDGAVMEIVTAIPQAFQRWDLIVTRALPRFQRQSRICSDRHGKDVQGWRNIFRWREAFCQCELVICVQRRNVAPWASFSPKDGLTTTRILVGEDLDSPVAARIECRARARTGPRRAVWPRHGAHRVGGDHNDRSVRAPPCSPARRTS